MIRSALLIAISAAAFAVEDAPQEQMNFHEVRVTLVSLPTSYTSHLQNKSTNKSYDSSGTLDSSGELSIGYQFSHYVDPIASVISGINLDFIGSKEKTNGVTDTTSNVGPSVHIGAGIRPVYYFNLEGLFFAGLGTAEEKTTGLFSKDISSSSGSYVKYGAELRGVFTMGPGFQLFAEIGYVGIDQTLKYSSDPSIDLGELEFTNKANGVMYGLGAGWRF